MLDWLQLRAVLVGGVLAQGCGASASSGDGPTGSSLDASIDSNFAALDACTEPCDAGSMLPESSAADTRADIRRDSPVDLGRPLPKGYVLTHEHPTQAMAFGGNYAFAGPPSNVVGGIAEKGYTTACGGCDALSQCNHGEVKGALMAALGGLGSDMGDHKSFKGPVHDSFSHVRYATDWVKEAFSPSEPELAANRMRIMVAYAIENEAICELLYEVNVGNGGAFGSGFPCSRGDSLASVERQIDALTSWATRNASWMEIAYSAEDARRIVLADKLAIVLGVESEYAFGAEDRVFDPVDRLARYHSMGIRTFYAAHKINSRLSGADIYYPKESQAGKAIRVTQAISGCFYYDDNVGSFPLENSSGHKFCENNCGKNHFKGNKLLGLSDTCISRFGEISEVNMADYVFLRGADEFNGFSIYPKTPGFSGRGGSRMDGAVERNNLGLSTDGIRVVREAMARGMLVNLDHVSSEARKTIYEIAVERGGYPLNAFHNNPNSMLIGSDGPVATPFPHEYDLDESELEFIRATGGFFGVRLGPLAAKDYAASGVTSSCPRTATENARVLAYLSDLGLSLGYSLDFSTVTEGVHSRTLAGCGLTLGPDELHTYHGETSEGLSHVGTIKYFDRELEAVGLKDSYRRKLRDDGVAAFIDMWQRAERLAQSTGSP